MIIDTHFFFQIVNFINSYNGLPRDCLSDMLKLWPNIPDNTLASILCTRYQKKMMTNHGRVKQSKKEVMKRYKEGVERKEEPGLIIRLAKHYDVAPALLAKVVLEESIAEKEGNKGKTDKDNPGGGVSKNRIKEMFKDTTQIQDPDLAYEVFLSIIFDNMYGPVADVVKRSLGVEYEMKLTRNVERVGLAYKTEELLREGGYDKTPDVKLDTPCAVGHFVINWIESKAVFGDKATHDQYAKDQYLSYWNRFGPGLVIYWFGCVNTVIQPNEKRFIVRDDFPENLTLMDPSIIEIPKLRIC